MDHPEVDGEGSETKFERPASERLSPADLAEIVEVFRILEEWDQQARRKLVPDSSPTEEK